MPPPVNASFCGGNPLPWRIKRVFRMLPKGFSIFFRKSVTSFSHVIKQEEGEGYISILPMFKKTTN